MFITTLVMAIKSKQNALLDLIVLPKINKTPGYLIMVTGIVASLGVLLMAACAVCSGLCCKLQNLFTCCNCFCGFIWAVVYMTIGVGLIVAWKQAEKLVKDVCDPSKTPTGALESLKDIGPQTAEIYRTIDGFFCATACPCSADVADPNFTDGTARETEAGGFISIQDCLDAKEGEMEKFKDQLSEFSQMGADTSDAEESIAEAEEMIEKAKAFMGYAKQIEETYKCSGLCEQEPIFYFSDCTVDVKEPCYKSIGKIIQGLFGNYGIVFVIASSFIIVSWCVNWGFCCCRKDNKTPGGRAQNPKSPHSNLKTTHEAGYVPQGMPQQPFY